MLKSFACRETEQLFHRKSSRRVPRDVQPRAFMRLMQIDAAVGIEDLRLPPSNRLEPLKGKRKGQWSIRINDQWRVCFRFEQGEAFDVEIADYHYTEVTMTKKLAPVHPGGFLEELLQQCSVSQAQLARAIGVSAMRVSHLVKGKRPVTAEMALRLARFFGQSPQYWLNLQSRYDLDCAQDAMGRRIKSEVRPLAA